MIIQSRNKSLAFMIDNYQYETKGSESSSFDYDANWLIAKITYTDENGVRKEYRDPCIMTDELTELADGLSKVVFGRENQYVSDFIEPYLKFTITKSDDNILFGIEYAYETTRSAWKSWELSEIITHERARQILEEIKAMSARFPIR